jgi:hypothetical protein
VTDRPRPVEQPVERACDLPALDRETVEADSAEVMDVDDPELPRRDSGEPRRSIRAFPAFLAHLGHQAERGGKVVIGGWRAAKTSQRFRRDAGCERFPLVLRISRAVRRRVREA